MYYSALMYYRCSNVLVGGYSHAQRTECAKSLVSEGPKTKLAKSQFLKRTNCHSIKNN